MSVRLSSDVNCVSPYVMSRDISHIVVKSSGLPSRLHSKESFLIILPFARAPEPSPEDRVGLQNMLRVHRELEGHEQAMNPAEGFFWLYSSRQQDRAGSKTHRSQLLGGNHSNCMSTTKLASGRGLHRMNRVL